jgi:hypothetical protein
VISFRFHLVSLVAVFLALGVGVLTGTTVINRGVVAGLESRTADFEAQADALREEVRDLDTQVEAWGEFGERAMPTLVAGRLTGQEVVLLTQEGTSEDSLADVRGALDLSGADTVASLSVTAKMALATEADREALSSIVGMDASEDPETLAGAAAALLAARIADGPNGTDTLERLLDADFLVIQGAQLTETGLRALGGPEEAVVTVAGGPAPSAAEPEGFLVPLVGDLAAAGTPVVAAEPAEAEEQEPPFVAALRGDAEVASLIATQDNVDQLPGQVGLVLALEDLLQGDPGHYGVKDGASAALPDLP